MPVRTNYSNLSVTIYLFLFFKKDSKLNKLISMWCPTS
jgi:hypothetical protein